jgi:DnaK suppressor protein
MRNRGIKRQLLWRRQQLLARYHGELERAEEELDSRESEDVEKATEQWDATVLGRLSDVDAAALDRIVRALRRLDEGQYGACVECGIAIEAARLRVLPETETCYACALDAEQPIRRVPRRA